MTEFLAYNFYLSTEKDKKRLRIEIKNLRKALDDFHTKWNCKPNSILLHKNHPLLLIKERITNFTKIPFKINNGVGINQIWLERTEDENSW